MKYPVVVMPQSRFLPDSIVRERLNPNLVDSKVGKNKAVFLDRDGTINVEPIVEQGYILDPKDIELNPTVGEAIRILNSIRILTIVITNQAAIDKKTLSKEQFEKINEKLWGELSKNDAHYDALYFCPHSPNVTPNCPCRKPKPGLILQAAIDFDIDLSASFVIGDKLTDIEAGYSSGCKTILLLSGLGEQSYKELKSYSGTVPNFVCQSLMEAVTWLLPNINE